MKLTFLPSHALSGSRAGGFGKFFRGTLRVFPEIIK